MPDIGLERAKKIAEQTAQRHMGALLVAEYFQQGKSISAEEKRNLIDNIKNYAKSYEPAFDQIFSQGRHIDLEKFKTDHLAPVARKASDEAERLGMTKDEFARILARYEAAARKNPTRALLPFLRDPAENDANLLMEFRRQASAAIPSPPAHPPKTVRNQGGAYASPQDHGLTPLATAACAVVPGTEAVHRSDGSEDSRLPMSAIRSTYEAKRRLGH
ncbi:hypothetical protein [Streptomyces sp. NPDC029554]|uniref:hypothetical protein n=1 Tax=Streptomyces sp. NPDC029554 TaxID=3155126 RepID=UPI0033FFB654